MRKKIFFPPLCYVQRVNCHVEWTLNIISWKYFLPPQAHSLIFFLHLPLKKRSKTNLPFSGSMYNVWHSLRIFSLVLNVDDSAALADARCLTFPDMSTAWSRLPKWQLSGRSQKRNERTCWIPNKRKILKRTSKSRVSNKVHSKSSDCKIVCSFFIKGSKLCV